MKLFPNHLHVSLEQIQNTELKFSCINKIISAFCLEDDIGVENFATVDLSVTWVSVTLFFCKFLGWFERR